MLREGRVQYFLGGGQAGLGLLDVQHSESIFTKARRQRGVGPPAEWTKTRDMT
jgi:hypothetical protein